MALLPGGPAQIAMWSVSAAILVTVHLLTNLRLPARPSESLLRRVALTCLVSAAAIAVLVAPAFWVATDNDVTLLLVAALVMGFAGAAAWKRPGEPQRSA